MVATSESGLIKMDKKSFIDRIASAENAERKAAKLPEFSADDTTSTTQTQGGTFDAFERNFKANHGEIILGCENLLEFLKSKGCKKGVIDAKLENTFGLEEHFEISREFDRNNPESFDFGISTASFAIAESGAIVLEDAATADRLSTIAPWIHIAVLKKSNIVRTIADALSKPFPAPYAIWISGPSKTSDVEGILVEGVHGPGIQAVFIEKD